MKNKMPLDGLGLGHDSGSVHCDMLKMLCFRTAWGGVGKYHIFYISLHPNYKRLFNNENQGSNNIANISIVNHKFNGCDEY